MFYLAFFNFYAIHIVAETFPKVNCRFLYPVSFFGTAQTFSTSITKALKLKPSSGSSWEVPT